jgi:hypothetical protein
MCCSHHYFVDKMLESCDFPECLASVCQFPTTSVSLHVAVVYMNLVSLKQVLYRANELFMEMYLEERLTDVCFITEIILIIVPLVLISNWLS